MKNNVLQANGAHSTIAYLYFSSMKLLGILPSPTPLPPPGWDASPSYMYSCRGRNTIPFTLQKRPLHLTIKMHDYKEKIQQNNFFFKANFIKGGLTFISSHQGSPTILLKICRRVTMAITFSCQSDADSWVCTT